jgi:hypothetical protein
MKLSQVQKILKAEDLCVDNFLHNNAHSSYACGLIKEMLPSITSETLYITSLTNIHEFMPLNSWMPFAMRSLEVKNLMSRPL